MAPKRKRATTQRRKPAKRQRRMTYGQVGGVSPGLIVGIGKAGYGITKAIGEHQQKRAKKISNGNAMRGNRLIVRSCENV